MTNKKITEDLFRDFKSATKESLAESGLDQEERDKIIYATSQSFASADLKIDYSNFENHIFFQSAFWAVRFALQRIFDQELGYPIFGTLQQKNEWRARGTVFENWFFDNVYPKQIGHVSFRSGSGVGSYIQIDDFSSRINPFTSSFSVEFGLKSHENIDSKNVVFSFVDGAENNGVSVFLFKSAGDKFLAFSVLSGGNEEIFSSSFDSQISSSNFVSFVYNSGSQDQTLYLNGEKVASRSLDNDIYEVSVDAPQAFIGAQSSSNGDGTFLFSGSLNDFRFWKSPRPESLIKRNFFRSVHANPTASLCFYYKFNELGDAKTPQTVIDYSGNGLHGEFQNNFSLNDNKISGSFLSFFKEEGDPIFKLTNSQVSSSIERWLSSGSVYDRQNNNLIWNLFPAFLSEEEGSEEFQMFLLLLSRELDKLKLYIENLAYINFSNESEVDVAPNNFLDLVAKNYGIDIGDVYTSPDALQYFFGENVNSSGSLDSSLKTIKDQLKRNVVNNLHYIIRTKSTREAVSSVLRSLGLDEDVVNVNEYSVFSGGIETSYSQKVVERRVANFLTSSNVLLTSSVYGDIDRFYEVRALMNTDSAFLTSSIFSINSGSVPLLGLWTERESLTSSYGTVKLHIEGADGSPLSSSLLKIYDNEWVNFGAFYPLGGGGEDFELRVARLFRDEVDFHWSGSADSTNAVLPSIADFTDLFTASLGTSGSNYFDGKLQEFRAWNSNLNEHIFEKHTKDFESLALVNFINDVEDALVSHLPMNDFNSSATGFGEIHDNVSAGLSGSFYSGFTTSSLDNFPGVYIDKLDQGYSYDIGINNDKIRIRNNEDSLLTSQIVEDIPFFSVDVSPVVALNKEIIKWFGDLENFSNLIGQPYKYFQEENADLKAHRSKFFESKLGRKLDFSAYFDFLRWFDVNFAFLIRQLIPLDLVSSVSNFVIEPHLFEQNKAHRRFPFKKRDPRYVVNATVSVSAVITALNFGFNLGLADPGRVGTPVQVSGSIVDQKSLFYSAESVDFSGGINYSSLVQRNVLSNFMSGNLRNWAPQGYGNGFHFLAITGSNHLKNTYGVLENATLADLSNSLRVTELSSAMGFSNSEFTGTMNLVIDQRWNYYDYELIFFGQPVYGPRYDHGIKYGGAFGQLPYISQKSIYIGRRGSAIDFLFSTGSNASQAIGEKSVVKLSEFLNPVEVREIFNGNPSIPFWPRDANATPTQINFIGSLTTGSLSVSGEDAAQFGDFIDIQDFDQIEIILESVIDSVTSVVGTPTGHFVFKIKFQFLNNHFYSDYGFESVLSSSLQGSNQVFIFTQKEYELEMRSEDIDFSSLAGLKEKGFILSHNRTIPQNKLLRIFMTVGLELDGSDTANVSITLKPRVFLFKKE